MSAVLDTIESNAHISLCTVQYEMNQCSEVAAYTDLCLHMELFRAPVEVVSV